MTRPACWTCYPASAFRSPASIFFAATEATRATDRTDFAAHARDPRVLPSATSPGRRSRPPAGRLGLAATCHAWGRALTPRSVGLCLLRLYGLLRPIRRGVACRGSPAPCSPQFRSISCPRHLHRSFREIWQGSLDDVRQNRHNRRFTHNLSVLAVVSTAPPVLVSVPRRSLVVATEATTRSLGSLPSRAFHDSPRSRQT